MTVAELRRIMSARELSQWVRLEEIRAGERKAAEKGVSRWR